MNDRLGRRSKGLMAAVAICGLLAVSPARAGKKSFVNGEYWQRREVAEARNGKYEVGIAVSCDGDYTIQWVKVLTKIGGSGAARKTFDTFQKNLGCPVLQQEKFYLMEYTFQELIDFLGASDSDTVNIQVQIKAVGGGKNAWEHLSVYKDSDGNVVTQRGNGGPFVAHTSDAPVTAYFRSAGLAQSEDLQFSEITNVKVDPWKE
jgi:hypothetical protein